METGDRTTFLAAVVDELYARDAAADAQLIDLFRK